MQYRCGRRCMLLLFCFVFIGLAPAAARAGRLANEQNEPVNGTVTAEADDELEEIEEVEIIEEVAEIAPGGPPAEFDGQNTIRRDRAINVLTARPVRAKSLSLIIDHRPNKRFWSGEDAFFNYLGLDGGGLKIGLGLRYGILDDLDVGLYRLNDAGIDRFDTYEFDARFRFLNQQAHGLDMAVRAGFSWFAQPDTDDGLGGFGQLLVDRIFFDSLLVGVGFTFHSDSSNDVKTDKDKGYSGAVMGALEWRSLTWMALSGEVSAALLGYKADWPAFSFGVKLLTHRHSFALLVSNTQYIATDGVGANTWRDFGDLLFGFRIVREFNF